jgi:hypothetical protein
VFEWVSMFPSLDRSYMGMFPSFAQGLVS